MTTLDKIAIKIIKEQELIIGPVAWDQASKVKGLLITDQKSGAVSIENGNAAFVIDSLVGQYAHLFGQASIEVCKEAAFPLISSLLPSEIPSSLK